MAESESKKKKICLVIPSLQAGGMERVMSELAAFFCKKPGLEVHMILYGISIDKFYNIPEVLVLHEPKTVFDNRLRFVYSLGRLYFLRKKIISINPDAVLSFGELWNSFVLLAMIGLSYPIYISDRCSPDKKFSLFHRLLRRCLYPRANGIIAQTLNAKKIYESQFRHHNVTVIGNPINQSDYPVIKRENIILTVGRLIKSKNHDKLIEIFCRINNPEWKLIIVGGDALKQSNFARLSKMIHKLKAESKVSITGYISNTEEFYQRSKIFAFVSTSEGFPNVIGEAMAAGLPVISFDCIAGPSEMIQNGVNGLLVRNQDYDTYTELLDKLMCNESLRIKIGTNASRSIKKFSLEVIGTKYLNFIIDYEGTPNKYCD